MSVSSRLYVRLQQPVTLRFSYLSLFFYDDAGSLGDGEGQQRSLDGGQDKVSVSLDHRVQVLPLWLAAVVHSYLV